MPHAQATNEHGQPIGEPLPGWEGRPAPERVTLTGRHLILEPLDSAHYAELFAATCAPEDDALWTYLVDGRPATLPELWMQLAARLEAEPTTYSVMVGGRPAGFLSLMRAAPAHGAVEVGGVLFGRTLQRTTAATEAIHLLMRYVFDDLGYRRFEWKCDSLNEPSRRAAARLGFSYEGRFRNAVVYKGRNRDTDWFSITDAEWPAIRAEHERWLDPANFDDEGRQLSALRASVEA